MYSRYNANWFEHSLKGSVKAIVKAAANDATICVDFCPVSDKCPLKRLPTDEFDELACERRLIEYALKSKIEV